MRTPRTVDIEITARCNLRCRHCFLAERGAAGAEPDAREVRRDGAVCLLTGYQFDILLLLARHPGRVLSRDAILDRLRGRELEAFDRSIDVHVSRIRAAIEDDPRKPRRLRTVRSVGYQFARLPEDAS